jgi:hypothetical protein
MSTVRSWIAICNWEGREPFKIGTFYTEGNDGIEVARAKATELCRKDFEAILPVRLPPPEHIRLVPGHIIVVED